MRAPDPLTAFVHAGLSAGKARPMLAEAMRAAGWDMREIEAALDAFADAPGLPPVPRPQIGVSAGEALRYGLLFVLLAMIAWHICHLGFAVVDSVLPDLTEGLGRPLGSLRWSMATLMPALPLFLWLNARIAAAAQEPGARRSAVRGWFTAAATLIAALILLGDLVGVLYAALSGELTPRFLAKAALIALTGGIVLAYLRDMSGRRAVAALAILGAAAIGAGLALTGGPAQGRAERRDAVRESDLHWLDQHVTCRAQAEGRLPGDLAGTAACPLTVRIADPFTAAPYRYEVIGARAWRLCADFNTPPPADMSYGMRDAAGCFTGNLPANPLPAADTPLP